MPEEKTVYAHTGYGLEHRSTPSNESIIGYDTSEVRRRLPCPNGVGGVRRSLNLHANNV
jgi:hypothetical protein